MNNNIRTTIFSPISDLQFKAGFDSLVQQGTEKEAAIKRAGAVIFADGRKIDKDLNSQQTMSVQQFIPANGFMPVFSVSRGLNVVEESLKTSRPDLTPFQIRNRPKFQLDPSLDKYVDEVFNYAIAPKLSLLDDDRILQQQFRQSVGLYSQKIRQLPLTDIQSDKAAKVARMIEQDAQVFRGVPVSGSTNVPDEAELAAPIDAPRPDSGAIQFNTDLASYNYMATVANDRRFKNLSYEDLVRKIDANQLINGGLQSALKRLSEHLETLPPDEQGTFEITNKAGDDLEKKSEEYQQYLKSYDYKLARMRARQRDQKMKLTGIPYYMTTFGKDITQALEIMAGGELGPSGTENRLVLTPLNTRLSKGVRVRERVHDSLKFLFDHLSDNEWRHFTKQINLKQLWNKNVQAIISNSGQFKKPVVEEGFDEMDVLRNEVNNRSVRNQVDYGGQVPIWMMPDLDEQVIQRRGRTGATNGFTRGLGMMGLITGALMMGGAFAAGAGGGGGSLFGSILNPNAPSLQDHYQVAQQYFGNLFGGGNRAPTVLNQGRPMINQYNDRPLGFAQNLLNQNQQAALQNAPAGFAEAAQQPFDWQNAANRAAEEEVKVPLANIPNDNPRPPARADGQLDVQNVNLEHQILNAVNENIPVGQGAVVNQGGFLQDPIEPVVQNAPAMLTGTDPYSRALAGISGGNELLAQDKLAETALKENALLAEKLEQEKVLQQKSGLSWAIRAVTGQSYAGEFSDRFGRLIDTKTDQDKKRLASITLTGPDGKPLTADALPAQEYLEAQINAVFDNLQLMRSVRADIQQIAQRVHTIQTLQQTLQLKEDQERENVAAGLSDGSKLESINQQKLDAQQALDTTIAQDVQGKLRVAKALTKAANVEPSKAVPVSFINEHLIANSNMEWIMDRARWLLESMNLYRVIVNLAIATTVVIGVPLIWTKLAGIKMVVGALRTRVLPSITGSASLKAIADSTQLPMEQVYAAYNSVMNKVSASGYKVIPSEEQLMSFLGDSLARAKSVYELQGRQYVESAQQMLSQGMTNGLQFARNYLQPSAEKKIANELVTIKAIEQGPTNRKTLNILGKRYKRRPGQQGKIFDARKGITQRNR